MKVKKKSEGYILFHFNLSFSSIKKKDQKKIIIDCYYPILKIAEKKSAPIAIELSAWTLQQINKIDKNFIFYLKKLIKEKKIEIVGSGYCQIIGPLIPSKVNIWNQEIGIKIYKDILNIKPSYALVNEMTMSDSMVQLYKKFKFKGIFLELDNTELALKKKINQKNYNGYSALNQKNISLPIFWTETILFQKLQRYIHNEISEREYLNFVNNASKKKTPLAIYSNDAEIFNFRPGRFKEEKKIDTDEWLKFERIIEKLKRKISINLPSNLKKDKKNILLKVNSTSFPITVKKQLKYNLSRWAISGHNSLELNSLCFKLFNQNKNTKNITIKKNIIEFWASDLRTHTRLKRWRDNIKRIRLKLDKKNNKKIKYKEIKKNKFISYDENNLLMNIKTKKIQLSLNLKKGLAIESLSFRKNNFLKNIGTLKQGFFSSIKFGVDYFSGNFVSEVLERKQKFTDLTNVKPKIILIKNYLIISSEIRLEFGKLKKSYWINLSSEEIKISLKFIQFKKEHSIIRPFHFTLCNLKKNIFYKCKNGGDYYEKYFFKENFDQSEQVSNFISNTSGLGASDGTLIIGDDKNKIIFDWDQSECALFPMIKHHNISDKKLIRAIFSCSEINDTSKKRKNNFETTLTIRPHIR